MVTITREAAAKAEPWAQQFASQYRSSVELVQFSRGPTIKTFRP